MSEPTISLTLQLLEWITSKPRTYAEVIDTWRTSCPRLSIWEDACIEGLIDWDQTGGHLVRPSPKGQALLEAHRTESAGGGDHHPPAKP